MSSVDEQARFILRGSGKVRRRAPTSVLLHSVQSRHVHSISFGVKEFDNELFLKRSAKDLGLKDKRA